MKYEKKSSIIIGIIFVIIFAILLFVVISGDKADTLNNDKKSNVVLLEDTNKFFTVSSCITKYITYLSSNDNEKVYSVLDSSYITKNSITKDNVFEFVSSLPGTYSQSSIRMYYNELNSYTTKYYVKYGLSKMTINGNPDNTVNYIIVILNQKNLTFSIIPYDGEVFINE